MCVCHSTMNILYTVCVRLCLGGGGGPSLLISLFGCACVWVSAFAFECECTQPCEHIINHASFVQQVLIEVYENIDVFVCVCDSTVCVCVFMTMCVCACACVYI